MTNEFKKIFTGGAATAAQRLLGCLLVHQLDGHKLIGRIIETEAYDQTDAASHSYNGRTFRNDVMFGPPGHLYVYFTYGMHYCCNIVTGPVGHGAAVLIRAIEPLEGEEIMQANRKYVPSKNPTNGPAKICQAFKIDKGLNGHDLSQSPLQLIKQPPIARDKIMQTSRVGIQKAKDTPWRFYIKNKNGNS